MKFTKILFVASLLIVMQVRAYAYEEEKASCTYHITGESMTGTKHSLKVTAFVDHSEEETLPSECLKEAIQKFKKADPKTVSGYERFRGTYSEKVWPNKIKIEVGHSNNIDSPKQTFEQTLKTESMKLVSFTLESPFIGEDYFQAIVKK